MKRKIVVIAILWFATSLLSCRKGTVDSDNSSQIVPTISVSTPPNNSTATDSVLITATTNDSSIVKVEFYIDGELVYTRSTTPWQFNWNVRTLPPNTTHTIQVRAYTTANNIIVSQLINITVQQTQEFLYPLTIGTSWKYRSYLESHTTAILHAPYQTGVHTWNVIGQTFSNDSIFYRIEVAVQDTQRYKDDTTFAGLGLAYYQFTITKTESEYIVNNEILKNTAVVVPRYGLAGTDTTVIGNPTLDLHYRFVNNLGLVSFSYRTDGNNTSRDSLNLISFIKT